MAGGHGIGALLQGPVQQGAEFDGPVAVQAGVGGAALGVLGDKAVYDRRPEQVPEVQHRVGNAQHSGGGPGGMDLALRRLRTVRPQAQGDAEDVIALPPQQKGGAGAVNTAAHGHTDAFKRHMVAPLNPIYRDIVVHDWKKEKKNIPVPRRSRNVSAVLPNFKMQRA